MAERQYSRDELAEMTGVPSRTIRFYIQQRLLDKPVGLGRYAYYTDAHVKRLREITAGKTQGLTLSDIPQVDPAQPQAFSEPIAASPMRPHDAPVEPVDDPSPEIERLTQINISPGVSLSVTAAKLSEQRMPQAKLLHLKNELKILLARFGL